MITMILMVLLGAIIGGICERIYVERFIIDPLVDNVKKLEESKKEWINRFNHVVDSSNKD